MDISISSSEEWEEQAYWFNQLGFSDPNDLFPYLETPSSIGGKAVQVGRRIVHLMTSRCWVDHRSVGRKLNQQALSVDEISRVTDLCGMARVKQDTMTEGPLESVAEKLGFLTRFICAPTTVGACLPSSPALARGMVEQISNDEDEGTARHFLEVGPGTGVFTAELALHKLRDEDTLDLVEFDEKFVEILQAKFAHMPNINIYNADIATWSPPENRQYNYCLSGLPLAAFKPDMVKAVYRKFKEVITTGGTLTYFDYPIFEHKVHLLRGKSRKNFTKVLEIKNKAFTKREGVAHSVPNNIPSARVTTLTFTKTRT